MQPHGVLPAFAHRLFRSNAFVEEFYRNGHGIVADLWTTRYDEMKNIKIALPFPPEQRAIADFLDDKVSKIDRAIAQKERLIELLQEHKQIIIQNAVTKGLDPSVKMKDSGIEWIGQIPEHWEVVKFRYQLDASPKNGTSPEVSEKGGVPTLSLASLKYGSVVFEGNLKFASISKSDSKRYQLKDGDVLVMRGNGSKHLVGTAGLVSNPIPEGCIYPDLLIRLTPNKDAEALFLSRMLNSTLRPSVEVAAKTAAGIWKISGESLSSLPSLKVPHDEQKLILRRLEETDRNFTQAIRTQKKSIQTLREYKATLIDSAVTGKIDVRAGSSVD